MAHRVTQRTQNSGAIRLLLESFTGIFPEQLPASVIYAGPPLAKTRLAA